AGDGPRRHTEDLDSEPRLARREPDAGREPEGLGLRTDVGDERPGYEGEDRAREENRVGVKRADDEGSDGERRVGKPIEGRIEERAELRATAAEARDKAIDRVGERADEQYQ